MTFMIDGNRKFKLIYLIVLHFLLLLSILLTTQQTLIYSRASNFVNSDVRDFHLSWTSTLIPPIRLFVNCSNESKRRIFGLSKFSALEQISLSSFELCLSSSKVDCSLGFIAWHAPSFTVVQFQKGIFVLFLLFMAKGYLILLLLIFCKVWQP